MRHAWSTWRVCAGRKGLCAWAVAGWERSGEHRGGVSSVYVALTTFARDKFVQGGLPADRIVVKPNFVHPDPGPRQGQGRYALFVGRLGHEKGVLSLLRAWADVPELALKIVGGRARACKGGVRDRSRGGGGRPRRAAGQATPVTRSSVS